VLEPLVRDVRGNQRFYGCVNMGVRRTWIAFLMVIAASGCSSGNPSASSPSSTTVATPAGPQTLARALARRMVDQAILPHGASAFTGPVPAQIAGPGSRPDVDNLVYAHRVYIVSETPYQVWHFLQAHVPHGFVNRERNSGTTRGQPSYGVGHDLLSLPLNVSIAELWISTAADPSGHAIIHVDGEAAWTVPRPAEEYVLPQDHVMIASTDHPYEPGKPVGRRVVVTDTKVIRPIAQAFDRLRLAPAGGRGECGFISNHAVVYRIAFAPSVGARPRLTANLSCYKVAVNVNGRNEPTLNNLPDRAWADLRRILGIPLRAAGP